MFPLVISEVNLVTIVCKCCVVENGLHFFCNLRAEHTKIFRKISWDGSLLLKSWGMRSVFTLFLAAVHKCEKTINNPLPLKKK